MAKNFFEVIEFLFFYHRAPCSIKAFDAWENLLQEVEVDSQVHSDVASNMARQISRPLIEKTFYRKIQSRKVFTHRESFETVLSKTEDMLKKVNL